MGQCRSADFRDTEIKLGEGMRNGTLRERETEGLRDGETERRRDGEIEELRDIGTEGLRDKVMGKAMGMIFLSKNQETSTLFQFLQNP